MNFHRDLRPDSESLVSTTGFATETVVLRPSTRAPRRPSPWDQPFFVVVLFLDGHSAHENRRRDRQLRDPVENGCEQVPRHGQAVETDRKSLFRQSPIGFLGQQDMNWQNQPGFPGSGANYMPEIENSSGECGVGDVR
jgi:hypothetical protein